MNLKTLSVATILFSFSSCADVGGVRLAPIPTGQEERYALDGMLFQNYPCTLLYARAASSRDSDEGVYDHRVILRFHHDKSRRVDIKVLAPGETFDDKSYDEWATYTVRKTKDGLHYSFVEKGAHELELHVRSITSPSLSRKVMPHCTVTLSDSSYTYILGGGNKLFIYELEKEAIIWASPEAKP